MDPKTFILSVLLTISIFISSINIYAGEFPKTLTAYLGTTPKLDGFISEKEYSDAEFLTGVKGWKSDTGIACSDSLDLSVKMWYKHDGTNLFFAFDVSDNIIYGFDTEKWLPAANSNANDLGMGVGWPYFGDGLEIMMNASYQWDDKKKSVGDGTMWQTICSTHKSFLGGSNSGGLIEGIPYTEYAWNNFREWYTKEYMKASVRIKTKEEGRGYVIEWRISPNPCMQIDAKNYVDLSKESKVGINIEFEDLDEKDDGLGSGNLKEFRHVDYLAKVGSLRKNIARSFATLLIKPDSINANTTNNSSILYQKATIAKIYPNPFSSEITIKYVTEKTAQTKISIYNTLGQEINILVNCEQTAGSHEITWDGSNSYNQLQPNNLYICKIVSGGKEDFHKILLLRK